MKTKTNEFGIGAIALPFHASTSGVSQGTSVSTPAGMTGGAPGIGGADHRLRVDKFSLAPDSLPGGPVI